MHRLFLNKTDKKKLEENPKLPYFRLVIIPEGDDKGDWLEVGAFWKAKSGNGYSGKTSDGVTITIEKKEGEEKKSKSSGNNED